MATTIPCSTDDDVCNCACNCQGFLADNRKITVGSIEIVAIDASTNQYTFNYTITNQTPAISYVIFCIQCQTSKVQISSNNTTIQIIGNPSTTPVTFTECFTSGCESLTSNSFFIEYDFGDESQCCQYQGIKIDINPDSTITEINFQLIFTISNNVSFGFHSGNLKLKSGQILEVVNDLCMPGCLEECDMQSNVCTMWTLEKNILESDKNAFTHFSQIIFPPTLDLSTLSIEELENRIRSIAKMEKCSANLICNVAKVLENLNNLQSDNCSTQCTKC